jgi:hypothetical protein
MATTGRGWEKVFDWVVGWQVDLHGLHVEEALRVLEKHLIALGGLGHPGGILLQVRHCWCPICSSRPPA